MEFYGRGFVADRGKIIASKRNEDTIVAELDLDEIKRARDILNFTETEELTVTRTLAASYSGIIKEKIS